MEKGKKQNFPENDEFSYMALRRGKEEIHRREHKDHRTQGNKGIAATDSTQMKHGLGTQEEVHVEMQRRQFISRQGTPRNAKKKEEFLTGFTGWTGGGERFRRTKVLK